MREKSKKLEPISGILAQVLDKLGLTEQMAQYQAVLRWEKVVGAQVSKHTKAYSIEKGILLVFVDSNVWIRELTFLKPDIIKKTNTELGHEVVKDIRFALMRRRTDG
jgi:predicted nucleic acid-binding Zn ribbon protein